MKTYQVVVIVTMKTSIIVESDNPMDAATDAQNKIALLDPSEVNVNTEVFERAGNA